MLNCPNCKRIVLDMTQDGGVKVRSRMIIFNGTEAHAICPSCKTNVSVPLLVDFSRLPHYDKPKHFVQN